MTVQINESKKTDCVPIIPRTFFPYRVKVIATDTSNSMNFEATGLLYETGEVVIAYPLKDQNSEAPQLTGSDTAIDIHTVVLPNGEEMDKGCWKEVAETPAYDRRLASSLGMMSDAGFAYGEGEGVNLFEQAVQAKANTFRLVGLPYASLLLQLGVEDSSKKRMFDSSQKILSVMMQDVAGDYDTPDQVPEWAWVEANASYVHCQTGKDGVWEFTLNLNRAFTGDPGRLASVVTAARSEGAAYLLIHQGT